VISCRAIVCRHWSATVV